MEESHFLPFHFLQFLLWMWLGDGWSSSNHLVATRASPKDLRGANQAS